MEHIKQRWHILYYAVLHSKENQPIAKISITDDYEKYEAGFNNSHTKQFELHKISRASKSHLWYQQEKHWLSLIRKGDQRWKSRKAQGVEAACSSAVVVALWVC